MQKQEWKAAHSVWNVSWRLALALFLVTACASDPTPTARPTPTPTFHYPLDAPPAPVTPEAVVDQLSVVSTLEDAARQFAAAMNIAPNAVRVRLETGNCTTCSIVENQQNTSLAGLSVDEAKARILAGNRVYLAMPRFVCVFDFDGSHYLPRECRHTPL